MSIGAEEIEKGANSGAVLIAFAENEDPDSKARTIVLLSIDKNF